MPDRPENLPDILFVITDDHRHDALGVANAGPLQTPTLDRLCARGTRWTHARICGGMDIAVCMPTRASMLTGRHPFDAVDKRDAALDGDRSAVHGTTLPEAFRAAGYRTYAVGKWHNSREAHARSFTDGAAIFMGGMDDPYGIKLHDFDADGNYSEGDARSDPHKHATDLFGDATCALVERHAAEHADVPMFTWLGLTSPHDPRVPAPPFDALYTAQHTPLPAAFREVHPFDNGDMLNRDERLAGHPRSETEVRRHEADYFGMLTHQDAMLGRVLDTLNATGRLENTIVVYTSDHGLGVGRHGLLGKQNLYDHSLGVPLIMAGPNVAADAVCDADVHSFDVGPTLLDLAGLERPATMTDAIALPAPGEASKRPYHFAVYRHDQRSVCDGRWKLIRYFANPDTGAGSDTIQLFDLRADPHELANLAFGHPDEVARLNGVLAEEAARRRDPLVRRF